MDYNCDIANFAAFVLLGELLQAVPNLFKSLQGGSQYVPVASDAVEAGSDEVDNWQHSKAAEVGARGVEELIFMLERCETGGAKGVLLSEVQTKCETQLASMTARAVEYGELPAAGVSTATAMNARNITTAMEKVTKTLETALAAARRSPGMAKLKEALSGQRVRRRFSLDCTPEKRPTFPSTATDVEQANAWWDFFGIPEKGRSVSHLLILQRQWEAHSTKLEPIPDATPMQVHSYWVAAKANGLEALASCALRHWHRPLSSASVERIFSHLTDMDDGGRRRMQSPTLHNDLFLRGNSRVMRYLLALRATEVSADTDLACKVRTALADAHRARHESAVEAASRAARANKRARGGSGASSWAADVDDDE